MADVRPTSRQESAGSPRAAAVRSALATAIALAISSCGGGGPQPSPNPNPSGWWRDKVVYEIFVRSFSDSNGDGIGDLQGLTAKLDYLNDGRSTTIGDLGIDAIWLMPIFPSPSYHGYDVTDYRSVNPQYGTLADFDGLIAAAHLRGIKVILDMVVNHSSAAHPWFLESKSGTTAPRRDWYVWRATDPGWPGATGGAAWNAGNGAYFYAAFNGTMPDLNLRNAAVEQELTATMKFWLARQVDGFRLDAVRYFVENGPGDGLVDQPETHALLKRLRANLQQDYPEALLVAEAWTPVLETAFTYYGAGDEVQLAFSFALASAILGTASTGDVTDLVSVLTRTEAALAGKDRGFEAPFLSNHDQIRVMRALNGNAAQARLAAATLFAMPGTPFLYYGEELGMQGYFSDPEKRTPFRWNSTAPGYGFTDAAATWFAGFGNGSELAGVDVASQRGVPGAHWEHYRELIALRHAKPALAGGEAARPAVSGGGAGAFALLRTAGAARVLFVANFAGAAIGPFAVDVGGTPTVLSAQGLSGPPTSAAGKISVPGLAARSFAFLSLE